MPGLIECDDSGYMCVCGVQSEGGIHSGGHPAGLPGLSPVGG